MKCLSIYIWTVISLVLVVYSCNSVPKEIDKSTKALPFQDTLRSEVVAHETAIFNINHVENIEDEYIVTIEERDQGIFKVFTLPDLDYLYSWGRKGKGPNEFSNLSMNSINAEDSQLILFDYVLASLSYYTITDTALVFQKELPLSIEGVTILNDVRRVSDQKYIAPIPIDRMQEFNNDELMALEPGNKTPLFTFGTYPESELEPVELPQEYTKLVGVKPDGSKIAAFYWNHNILKIYDNEGQLLQKSTINDPYISDDGDGKFTYRFSISTTNKYVYALAVNRDTKETDQLNFNEIKISLEIWDWNGQPVHRLILDRFVARFTVSETYNKLYGFNPSNPGEIYEYNLTSIFDSDQIATENK